MKQKVEGCFRFLTEILFLVSEISPFFVLFCFPFIHFNTSFHFLLKYKFQPSSLPQSSLTQTTQKHLKGRRRILSFFNKKKRDLTLIGRSSFSSVLLQHSCLGVSIQQGGGFVATLSELLSHSPLFLLFLSLQLWRRPAGGTKNGFSFFLFTLKRLLV